MDRQLRQVFDKYFEEQVRQADAVTPQQKKAMIAQLCQETREGKVPLCNCVVRVSPAHPAFRALDLFVSSADLP